MILLTFNIDKLTTEQIQELGERWLTRLKGWAKTCGKKYLYRPASNYTRSRYGTCEQGRAGVIGIFLEIIANVLLQEQEESIRFEGILSRKEKRDRRQILPPDVHHIPQDGFETYKPFRIA